MTKQKGPKSPSKADHSRANQPALIQFAKTESIFESPDDVTPIIEFLENFQKMVDPRAKHPSQLISIKIPVPLLSAFKARAKLLGIPYQTLIKKLMLDSLKKIDV